MCNYQKFLYRSIFFPIQTSSTIKQCFVSTHTVNQKKMWEFHITGQIKVQNTMAQIFCSNWLPPIVRMSPERKKMFIFFHRCNYVYTTYCKKIIMKVIWVNFNPWITRLGRQGIHKSVNSLGKNWLNVVVWFINYRILELTFLTLWVSKSCI